MSGKKRVRKSSGMDDDVMGREEEKCFWVEF